MAGKIIKIRFSDPKTGETIHEIDMRSIILMEVMEALDEIDLRSQLIILQELISAKKMEFLASLGQD